MSKLEEKRDLIQEDFESLEAKRQELIKQRQVLDKDISAIQSRLVALQGAYSAVMDLLKDVPNE